MGYTTYARGEIRIEPPIRWREVKDSPFLPNEMGGSHDLNIKLVVQEFRVDTDTGEAINRVAAAVEQRYEDEPRNYEIVPHLQQLIDAFPGHEFVGRFDCEGEETGDLWRLEVHGRKAVRVDPRIVWPDGSETKAR